MAADRKSGADGAARRAGRRPSLLVPLATLALLPGVAGCGAAPAAPAAAAAAGRAEAARLCRPSPPSGSGFELIVLGSGGPRSFGRAASSYVVAIDGVPRLLIDAGPGAFLRLGELDLDFEALDTVLLTHLHIDHAGDLPGFVKSRDLTYNRPLRFRVFGPEAGGPYPSTTAFVDRLFGDAGAFAYLPGFRNQLRFELTELAPSAEPSELFAEGGLRVTAIGVDHGDVPALAYRVEHAGHSLVVSGDLASKDDRLATLAAGADVLIYDAAVLDPPAAPPQLYELHTPPRRIGEVAARAGVRSLLLGHLTPAVERAQDSVRESIRGSFQGDVRFAHDCQRLDVPPAPARH